MSTALELEPTTSYPDVAAQENSDNALSRIRNNFAACRVKFKWLGTAKSLSSEQKTKAAESFGADGNSISAGKRLIDTKHDSYRTLTSLKSQIIKFWKDNSLPYPEPGMRLIKQSRVDEFHETLLDFQAQLAAGVRLLEDDFYSIKDAAQMRLGSLYDESDYPTSLVDEFEVTWDFPSVDPPDYLMRLNPELYSQEARRVSRRFEHALEMAEQAFLEEFDRLISHLSERLTADEQGRPKTFRDSAVTNLKDFFERFRELNVGSNEELDELVEHCERVVGNSQPQGLRDSDSLRQRMTAHLSDVQASLEEMIVDRPRRNIARPNRGLEA